MKRKIILITAVSAALAGGSSELLADEASIMKELQALKARVEQLERELAESRNETGKADKQPDSGLVEVGEKTDSPDKVVFQEANSSPVLVSSDGTKSLGVHGRVFIDVASLPDQYRYGRISDFYASHHASEFRRIYLGVAGRFASNWEYALTLNFAEQDVDLKDAHISYTGWDRSKLIMGYQKPTIFLEHTGSSNYTLFMTRGLTDSFSDERALGASWAHAPSWGSLNFGAFVPNSFVDGKLDDHTRGETQSGDKLVPLVDSSEIDRYALTGRTSWAPVADEGQVLHLGASVLYASYDEPTTVNLRGRPAAHLAEHLVYARVENAKDFATWGLEGALIWNNFLVQTEYLNSSISAGQNYTFDGYYIAGAWLLTGESHPYRKDNGKIGTVKPRHPLSNGGWGAWEFAVRFGTVDLSEKDIRGGSLKNITIGLNWYMENNIRAMLNYVHFKADDYEDSDDYVDSQDGDILEGRLAWFF